jgi:hypothetical protein
LDGALLKETNMKRSFNPAASAGALLFLAAFGGCSLFVKFDDDCTSNTDCAAKGANLVCVDHFCVLPDGADGGPSAGDAGGSCDGASFDPHVTSCFACPASTNLEFLNACSGSMCEPFDDSKRLTKVYADGGFPPVPDPPDSGM